MTKNDQLYSLEHGISGWRPLGPITKSEEGVIDDFILLVHWSKTEHEAWWPEMVEKS